MGNGMGREWVTGWGGLRGRISGVERVGSNGERKGGQWGEKGNGVGRINGVEKVGSNGVGRIMEVERVRCNGVRRGWVMGWGGEWVMG